MQRVFIDAVVGADNGWLVVRCLEQLRVIGDVKAWQREFAAPSTASSLDSPGGTATEVADNLAA